MTILVLIYTCLIFSYAASAQVLDQEIIVLLKNDIQLKDLNLFQAGSRRNSYEQLSQAPNIYLLHSNSATALMRALKKENKVLALQYNQTLQIRNTLPNDLDLTSQWALDNINVSQAWQYSTGGLSPNGDTIVAAVIDRSFYIEHEDLSQNIWHNHAEIPNDSIDNDQNGKIDDYTGWQIIFDTDKHDYGDINNHGSSILGIIGAVGDNSKGIVGINWAIKMMLLSMHDGTEITKLSNIIEGYSYCLDMRRKYNQSQGQQGAFVTVVNSSWGIDFAKASEHPIWCALYDSLGQAGILSTAASSNTLVNIDMEGDMPSNCRSDYLVVVNQSSQVDDLSHATSFGPLSVDLSAPSRSRTTQWLNKYGSFGGTSGAAPQVAGAIALLYSYQNARWGQFIRTKPAEAALLIKDLILASVDKKTAFEGKTLSEGRLNIGRAMQLLSEYFSEPNSNEFLSLFPNPTTERIYLRAAFAERGLYPIYIYNSTGQLVLKNSIKVEEIGIQNWPIAVQKLNTGLYVLVIQNKKIKFIKR